MVEKAERSTTSITIDKEDLPHFKTLKAKEGGRRGAAVSQPEFIRFLLCLYQEAADHDATVLDEAQRRAESE